jgi:6-phosphogluconate dehydrogenase
VEAIARAIGKPRAVWLMLPAGEATEKCLGDVASQLDADDVIIDGGNTFWKDDIRRADMLARHGVHYVDVGTSGASGDSSAASCLMAGGERAVVDRLRPIFEALAPPGGFVHTGPTGAGHFVKMVHNGIEYGLMQAYAEGFDILRNAAGAERRRARAPGARRRGDRRDMAARKRHRLMAPRPRGRRAREGPELSKYSGVVADSGEGRWGTHGGDRERVPRMCSPPRCMRASDPSAIHTYAEKVLSALREAFGGHVETQKARLAFVVMGVSVRERARSRRLLADRLALEYVDADWLHPECQRREDAARHPAWTTRTGGRGCGRSRRAWLSCARRGAAAWWPARR